MFLKITKKQFVNLQFNLGHSKRKWIRFMDTVFVGVRNNMLIFNLDYTLLVFKRAISFIIDLVSMRGRLFFVSSFLNSAGIGLSQHLLLGENRHGFYDGPFIGGLVSNIRLFLNVIQLRRKKVAFNFYNLSFYYPSCVVVGDSNKFFFTIKESLFLGIPSVSLIDSDLFFSDSFYPVFGNNESIFSIFFFSYMFALSAKLGRYKEKRLFLTTLLRRFYFFLQLKIMHVVFGFFVFFFFKLYFYFVFIRFVLGFFLFLFFARYKLLFSKQDKLLDSKFYNYFASIFFVVFFMFLLFFLLFKKQSKRFSFQSFSRLRNKKRKFIFRVLRFKGYFRAKVYYLFKLFSFHNKAFMFFHRLMEVFFSFFGAHEHKTLLYFFFRNFFKFLTLYKYRRNVHYFFFFQYYFLRQLRFFLKSRKLTRQQFRRMKPRKRFWMKFDKWRYNRGFFFRFDREARKALYFLKTPQLSRFVFFVRKRSGKKFARKVKRVDISMLRKRLISVRRKIFFNWCNKYGKPLLLKKPII
jgi:ribosomal protein S2